MHRKLSVLLLCLFAFPLFSGCSSNNQTTNDPNKLQIAVSFNAVAELVEAVGKDKVEITTIIPDGTNPHDFEPNSKSIQVLNTADLFIYNGLDMELWATQAFESANNENLTRSDISKGIMLILNNADVAEKYSMFDPHIWLSLTCAKMSAGNIKDILVEADPENKDYYEQNCNEFTSQLDALYNEYQEKFDALDNKSFITGHTAFNYFCRDFGLIGFGVEDVYAQKQELDDEEFSSLVSYCRENNINTIFTEDITSTKTAEKLAKEIGAKTEKLYTLESSEDNLSYMERMEYNLQKIYDSLS